MAVNCRVYYSHFLCFRSRFRFSKRATQNRSVLALFHLCQSLYPTIVDWCVVCDIFGASDGIARMLSVCLSFFRHCSKDKRADKWARWSRSVCAAKFQFIHFRRELGMAAMATEACVAAAGTAAVGFGLFNYNRRCPSCPWTWNT